MLLSLVSLTLLPTTIAAQIEPPATGGAVQLDYLLQRLGESRRVLVIAAHPDDEDTALLAMLSRGVGARTAYLALSRGEGGQNLIGNELGTELGLLRTAELLSARSLDGAEQYFTRAFDFGYTRDLSETERFWPPDSILKDVLRIVRRFRPHVIVSIFSGTRRDGHGQHQMAGVMARRAFDAAGDPDVFPELEREEGLAPWRPLKLYRSTRFDRKATTLSIETGGLDPRLGKSFHQIAMAGRSRHRSQDMGRLQEIGPRRTTVRLESDRTGKAGTNGPETGLFDGIPADRDWWNRVADSLRSLVAPSQIATAVPALNRLSSRLGEEQAEPYVRRLVDRAILTASGIVLDAVSTHGRVVRGSRFEVTVELFNGGPYPVEVSSVGLSGRGSFESVIAGDSAGDSMPRILEPGANARYRFIVSVRREAPLSQPYFLEAPRDGWLYDWDGVPAEIRGLPFGPPVLNAEARLRILDTRVIARKEVAYRYNNQAVGEVREAVRVVPRVDVKLQPETLLWRASERVHDFTVHLTYNDSGPTRGTLELAASGWKPVRRDVFFERSGETKTFHLALSKPPDVRYGKFDVRAVLILDDGTKLDRGESAVSYPHIRARAMLVPSTAKVVVSDIKFPVASRIGYIRGAADRVPEALAQIGLHVNLLGGEELDTADLSGFDVIIVGGRAYEVDSSLVEFNDRLLDYVRNGGRLLVQYQQYQFVHGGFAPYELTIARPHDRVTDESSPVTVLAPDDPEFHQPNEITEEDWEGWPQERGLYFAHTWDERYRTPLEMGDPGRERIRGGLLIAPYGKGRYIYTGISFFRSLPAGVPGAFKLFLNLMDLGRKDAF